MKSENDVGLFGLLGIMFVALRLCGVTDWSWTWVLAPFWVPTAVALALIVIIVLLNGIIQALK